MQSKVLITSLTVLQLCGTTWVLGEPKVKIPNLGNTGRCSPIVPSPGCPFTHISRRLFTESDFELAIIQISSPYDGFFRGFIVRKVDSAYRCDVKSIRANDVLKDGRIVPTLLASCKVEVKSKAIDLQAVELLTDTLRKQVAQAAYQTKPPDPMERRLDGASYHVFVKGAPEDLYDVYAGEIDDALKTDSRSCSTITYVLANLVLSDNDKLRAEPLNKLTKYLKSVADGHPAEVDPFLDKEEPEPDVILPPL